MKSRHKYLLISCFCTLGLVINFGSLFSQQSAGELFEKALYVEEAQGDLEKAIGLYQQILKKFSESRDVCAKAQLKIGLCYEKLGNTEAIKAFELVLKNFADRPDEVAIARERLSALRQGISSDLSVTNLPDVETEFWPYSFSPDGTKMLGSEEDTGGVNIVYLDIPSGLTVPVTHFDYSYESSWAAYPIWSPDGKEIAYEQNPNSQTAWKSELIINKIGGNPRVVFSTEDGEITPSDWLRDGSAIVAVWTHLDKSISLGLVPVGGGPFKRLCSIQHELPIPRPQASPDGRFIVFEEGGANARNIRIISVDGASTSLLTDHPADDKQPCWSPDGKHIVFLSARLGGWALWGTAVKDGHAVGQPFMIREGMADTSLFNWTTHGLACQKWVQSNDIFIQSMDPRTNKLIDKAQLLSYAPTGKNSSPRWSPDGKFLAFISCSGRYPTETRVVVMRQENGKAQEYVSPLSTLSGFSSFKDYLAWVPDSSGLVFAVVSGNESVGPPILWKLDFASGEWSPFSLPGSIFDWGPDGKSVFYALDAYKVSEPRIVERNLGTGEEKCIYRIDKARDEDINGLRLSRDFRWLQFSQWTFTKPNNYVYQIQTLDLESGQMRTAFSGSDVEGVPSWSPDGRYLLVYYGENSGWQKDIALIPAAGGPMQKLKIDLNWPEGGGIYGRFTSLDWSPDGTKIALSVWSSIEQTYLLKNVIPKDRR